MTEPISITLDDVPEEPQHQTEVAVVTPHQDACLLVIEILAEYVRHGGPLRLDAARVILEELRG